MTFQEIEERRREHYSRTRKSAKPITVMVIGEDDEWMIAHTYVARDMSRDVANGFTFQRCGGGRRVIRKRIGGTR